MPNYLADLPYIKDIRRSWIANLSHCDPSSPSRREHYIEKGITICPEWTGPIGFLRYYIFHMDNQYVAGRSKLQRKDDNKGFSKENCIIVHTRKMSRNGSKKKIKPKALTTGSHPTEVINNNIFIVDGNTDIVALISNLNINTKRVLGELN